MKNIVRLLFVALFMVSATIPGKAHVYVGKSGPTRGSNELKQTTAGCSPSSAFEWLNINNVRTRINAGGDMWWDLEGGIGALLSWHPESCLKMCRWDSRDWAPIPHRQD